MPNCAFQPPDGLTRALDPTLTAADGNEDGDEGDDVEEVERPAPDPADPPYATILRAIDSVTGLSTQQKIQLFAAINNASSPEDFTDKDACSSPATEMESQPPSGSSRRGARRRRNKGKTNSSGVEKRLLQTQWQRQQRLAGGSPGYIDMPMTLVQSSLFAACFQNAVACGMANPKWLVEDEGLSPFSLDPVPSGDLVRLFEARQRFSAVPKDLRPCDDQILIEHHPYIVSRFHTRVSPQPSPGTEGGI